MTAPLLAFLLGAAPAVVVGPVRDGAVVAQPSVPVRSGESAPLAVVLVAPDGACLAGRDGISLDGRRCAAAPAEVASTARWVVAVPIAADYDNTAACSDRELVRGCHAPIRYREVELEALRGRLEVDASTVPALAALGAHRIGVRLSWNGETLAAPAAAAAPPEDATVPSWLELVVRRDDGYVGRLTELLGLPFALAPTAIRGVGHQTDARLAADCVAVVVYGRRRLGEGERYASPRRLRARLALVGRAAELRDRSGRVPDVGPIREGDVLHFGFQTAVLSRDLPPRGRLDPGDLVIHAYHGLVEEVPVARLPYAGHAVEILRWPGEARAHRGR